MTRAAAGMEAGIRGVTVILGEEGLVGGEGEGGDIAGDGSCYVGDGATLEG